MIKRLRLKKLLSFNDTEIELRPLNVLIGPNGVGKSNLIEAVSLLQAAPSNLEAAIRRGGGVKQWVSLRDNSPIPVATVESEIDLPRWRDTGSLVYGLSFSQEDFGEFVIRSESLAKGGAQTDSSTYFARHGTWVKFGHIEGTSKVSYMESVLSLFKSPGDPTPITDTGRSFEQIKIYRDFRTTGVSSQARYGISTSVSKDSLADEGDNLALVLQELDFLGIHDRIPLYLQRFCERFEDVKIRVGAGIAQIYLKEAGLVENLSAIRMSDGTLKFLCLLVALLHPKRPPLMCIEEPELGLHPDAMQLVAELLVEASESMQLIVTTHSEALVDALSELPESVLICERDFANSTQFKRLDKEDLHDWLEDYSLGQLWRKGEIGGRRW